MGTLGKVMDTYKMSPRQGGGHTACAGTAIPWDGVFWSPGQDGGEGQGGDLRYPGLAVPASTHGGRGVLGSGGAGGARSLRSC